MFFDEEIKKTEFECLERIFKMTDGEKSRALDITCATLEEERIALLDKSIANSIIDSVNALSERNGDVSNKYDDVRNFLMTGSVGGNEIVPVSYLGSLYDKISRTALFVNNKLSESPDLDAMGRFYRQLIKKFGQVSDFDTLKAEVLGVAVVSTCFKNKPIKKVFDSMNLNTYVLAMLIADVNYEYYKKSKADEERKKRERRDNFISGVGSLLGSLFGKYTDYVNQQMYGIDTSQMSNQDKFRVFHENRTKD